MNNDNPEHYRFIEEQEDAAYTQLNLDYQNHFSDAQSVQISSSK